MAANDDLDAVATAIKEVVDTFTYDVGFLGKIQIGKYVTPEEVAQVAKAAIAALDKSRAG